MKSVQEVRIGKFVELKVSGEDSEKARRVTDEACKKLLSNPVMEDYSFSVEKL